MYRYRTLIFICLAIPMLRAPVSSAGQNLLADPQVQGSPSAWRTWARRGQPEFAIDRNIGHGDSASLRITSPAPGVDGAWLQPIPVRRWRTYDYSFWLRTDVPRNKASLLVEFPLPNGIYMGQHRRDTPTVDGGWTLVTGSFRSPISGTATFEVWANLDNTGTGSAWFDDFSLTESVAEKPDVDFAIEWPATRVLSPAQREVRCRMTIRRQGRDPAAKYTAEIRAGSKVVGRASGSAVDERRFTIAIPDGTPCGRLDATFRLLDRRGRVLREVSDILIRQSGSAEVGIGAHGELLVKGKPFLPIAVCWPRFDDLSKLPGNGFNSFHMGLLSVEESRSYLAEAGRLGLMLIPEFSELLRRGETHYAEIADRVKAFRGDPSLLCYWMIDEPLPVTSPPAVVRRAYDLVKVLDPEHPVLYDEPALAQMEMYRGGADIIGTDPYLEPAAVAGWITAARQEGVAGSKPIWVVIGVCPMEGMPEWPSEPSAGYARSCVYASLIAGARGVMYFSQRFEKGFDLGASKIWPALGELNREIARLAPYLLAAQPVRVKSSDPNLLAARFDSPRGSLLLAVNTSSTAAVDVSLDLPDVRGTAIGVFDGTRKGCDGRLRLSLRPRATAAFRLK